MRTDERGVLCRQEETAGVWGSTKASKQTWLWVLALMLGVNKFSLSDLEFPHLRNADNAHLGGLRTNVMGFPWWSGG